jgi:arylsulfatase B
MFVYWPNGGLTGGRDVEPITAYVDVLPTLIDLCDLDPPAGVKFDGTSLVPLLSDEAPGDWPDRILVTDSQRVKDPIKWKSSAVMTGRWRLINGKELYDIKSDPGQKRDVASQHPNVVRRLTDFYEAWWAELEPTFADATSIYLGHPDENPARLTSHDWITTRSTPWNQSHVRSALTGEGNTGYWNVLVHQPGRYEIRLRRWPEEADAAIDAALPAGADVPGVKAYRTTPGKGITPNRAVLTIGEQTLEKGIEAGDKEVVFKLNLPAGKTRMQALFESSDGSVHGAYYAYVERKE